MFQTRTGQFLATLSLFALSALPMTANATEPLTPTLEVQAVTPVTIQDKTTAFLQEDYFDELRFETKAKLSESQRWMKHQADEMGYATDRLQTRVAPAGRSLKTSLKNKLPGLSLVQRGDRTFSVYGLILMMAFGLVLLLMGLSGPMSRLGGRH